MNQNLNMYETESITKVVLKNTIPSMVSMIMVLIYNMADMFFIGLTRDPLQVAAVSLATPVFLFSMAIGNLFGIGGTSLISRSLGSNRPDYARNVCSFCCWAGLAVSAVFMVAVLSFINPILGWIGTSPATFELTKSYLFYVTLGSPFVVFSTAFSNIIRAEGKPNVAMIGMLIGNLLNIVLDPILISGLGMGVSGAAIATVIGNLVGAVYYLLYFLRKKSMLSIHPRYFRAGNGIATGVLAIGIPASLNNILMSLSHIILNALIASYGDMAVAAMGVATKIMMFVVMIQIGFGQGLQPVFGYYYGAAQSEKFKKVLRFSLILASVLSAVMAALCFLGSNLLVSVFLEQPQALEYGVSFTRIQLASGVIYGILFVLTNALQAIGAAVPSLILSISRQGLIYIPVMYLLGALFGLTGLVAAQPVTDILTVILAVALFFWTYKKMVRPKNTPLPNPALSES